MRLIVLLVLCFICLPVLISHISAEEPLRPGIVNHERGKLKDVIVGIDDDLVIPSYSEAVSFFYGSAYIEEMKKLGANLFVLDDNAAIIDKLHRRVGQELKKKGVKVIEIPYDKVASCGDGLRFSHNPLIKESVLPPAPARIVTGATLPVEVQEHLKKIFGPPFLFEDRVAPKAPDYRQSRTWAALPSVRDEADAAPPNTKYPEAQKNARADVFFIHPTGYSKPDSWNGPINDPDAMQAVSLVMGYLASSFNAAARVYAPRYRQATLYAFLDHETSSGLQAINLAYSDIERAFEYYIKIYNKGRPFILAAHSQGSNHGLRLLQQKIIGTPLQKRLAAAYLIGMAIPKDIPGINASQSATDTGTVIGWNSYTSIGNPKFFTEDMAIWYGGSYRKSKGLSLVQVNPLSWKMHGGKIEASTNPGSLPVSDSLNDLPALVPGVTGADASGDVLIIEKPIVSGFPGSGPETPILNADFGDYHDYDYMLFYESIRKNAIDRVKAFTGKGGSKSIKKGSTKTF